MSGLFVSVMLMASFAGQRFQILQNHASRPSISVQLALILAHNRVRTQAHVPPLAWSGNLAQYAQQWADTLIARNAFSHRPGLRYGENLYEIRGGHANATPQEVVAAWASEARNYDPRTNTCRGVCGHYTQLVWGATRRVGCGSAQRDGVEVWVCDYDPPGNIVGERP